MSTTKRQQEKTDWPAVGFSVGVLVILIVVLVLGFSWWNGWQEKWRDTGVVLSRFKSLDTTPGSQCCSFIFNYTILTDHHGQIVWTSNENCLGSFQDFGRLNVSQIVGIKACNNGFYEVHGDP